jgi:hypothetical protein
MPATPAWLSPGRALRARPGPSAWLALTLVATVTSGCSAILDLAPYQNGAGLDATAIDGGSDRDAQLDTDSGSGPDARGPADAHTPDAPAVDAQTPDAHTPDAPTVDAHSPADTSAGWVLEGDIVGLPEGTALRYEIDGHAYEVEGLGDTPRHFAHVRGSASYSVRVTTQPADHICIVYRGEGSAAGPVTGVFIGCSTSRLLVGYYPFDGGVVPSSAVAGLASWTQASGTPRYVAGRFSEGDQALGMGGDVDLQLDEGLGSVAGEGYTVSMWVHFVAPATDYLIVHQNGAGDPTPVALRIEESGRFEHYVYWNGVPDASSTFSAPVAADAWHHVVAVSEITGTSPQRFTVRLFVDGVRTTRDNEGQLWQSGSTNWHVFAAAAADRDDLRIYRRPLSDSEVATLYTAERAVVP